MRQGSGSGLPVFQWYFCSHENISQSRTLQAWNTEDSSLEMHKHASTIFNMQKHTYFAACHNFTARHPRWCRPPWEVHANPTVSGTASGQLRSRKFILWFQNRPKSVNSHSFEKTQTILEKSHWRLTLYNVDAATHCEVSHTSWEILFCFRWNGWNESPTALAEPIDIGWCIRSLEWYSHWHWAFQQWQWMTMTTWKRSKGFRGEVFCIVLYCLVYTYGCTANTDHIITYWFKQKVWKQELLWTAISGECTHTCRYEYTLPILTIHWSLNINRV